MKKKILIGAWSLFAVVLIPILVWGDPLSTTTHVVLKGVWVFFFAILLACSPWQATATFFISILLYCLYDSWPWFSWLGV